LREESARLGFFLRVAPRRRIGNPQIQLKRAVARGAKRGRPALDCFGRHEQRAASRKTAGVGDRDRERGRAGAGHRREQDRRAEREALAEALGAGEGGMHVAHELAAAWGPEQPELCGWRRLYIYRRDFWGRSVEVAHEL